VSSSPDLELAVPDDLPANYDADKVGRLMGEALSDGRWEFRTVHGIASTTQLPEDVVQRVVDANLGGAIRLSLAPTAEGDPLYTLKSRPSTLREKLAGIQAIASK
jgi:hypothetical protein